MTVNALRIHPDRLCRVRGGLTTGDRIAPTAGERAGEVGEVISRLGPST